MWLIPHMETKLLKTASHQEAKIVVTGGIAVCHNDTFAGPPATILSFQWRYDYIDQATNPNRRQPPPPYFRDTCSGLRLTCRLSQIIKPDNVTKQPSSATTAAKQHYSIGLHFLVNTNHINVYSELNKRLCKRFKWKHAFNTLSLGHLTLTKV